MIYALIFIWITLVAFFEINQIGKSKIVYHVLYVFTGIILVFFAGTRNGNGYDFAQYQFLYEGISLQNYASKAVEIGFAFIIYISRSAGLNLNAFLFMVALFSVSLKLEYFRQNSLYLFLALLNYYCIGFIINEFGQIRHGIAIAIALFAFKDLMEDKPYSFFLKVLVGFLIHASILVLIPAYFLIRAKWLSPKIMMLSFIPLMAFVFIDIKQIVFNLLSFVPFFQVQAKITFYVFSDDFGQNLGINISFLLRFLTFVLMVLFMESGQRTFNGYIKLLRLYYFGLVLYLIFSSIAEFAIRSSTYFKTLDAIILPFFVSLGKTRTEKNVITFLIVLYCFYSIFKVVYSGPNSFVFHPYKSVLENLFFVND